MRAATADSLYRLWVVFILGLALAAIVGTLTGCSLRRRSRPQPWSWGPAWLRPYDSTPVLVRDPRSGHQVAAWYARTTDRPPCFWFCAGKKDTEILEDGTETPKGLLVGHVPLPVTYPGPWVSAGIGHAGDGPLVRAGYQYRVHAREGWAVQIEIRRSP